MLEKPGERDLKGDKFKKNLFKIQSIIDTQKINLYNITRRNWREKQISKI